MSTFGTTQRNRNLKRLNDEARQVAVSGDWEKSLEINRQILEQNPSDVGASNRLGKALDELGRIDEAIQTYKESLNIEPSNLIAQRSLGRLEQYNSESVVSERPADVIAKPIQAGVFIEETGKTYVTEVVRPTNGAVMTRLTPATELDLRVEDQLVGVYDPYGNRVGQLEARIAQRLIELMNVGNQYKAFVVQLSGHTVRIIVREVFRDPDAPLHLALPPQAKMPAPRPYIRDTSASTRDLDPDYYLDDDETDDTDETEADELAEKGMSTGDSDDEDADDQDTGTEEVVGESRDDDEDDTPIVR